MLVQGPIDQQQVTDLLVQGSSFSEAGAQDFFIGQIRADEIEGKKVKAIEFSAYAEMVQPQLQKVMQDVRQEFPDVVSLKLVHSVGEVKVGEVCMVVHVVSGHRDAAFKACRAFTEKVKFELPIFGKEIIEDGLHVWKKNV